MILRKEDKTMNYTKPEVAVLGKAAQVIEQIPPKQNAFLDNLGAARTTVVPPAYDLDE
jgi:hypothetical protein